MPIQLQVRVQSRKYFSIPSGTLLAEIAVIFLTRVRFPLHSSPSAEKLYATRWNDDCYFFGGSECNMTSLVTAREINLAKLTESSLRGLSGHSLTATAVSLGAEESKKDSSNDVDAQTNSQLAEDAFLCTTPPSCLLSLPFYLRHAACFPPRQQFDDLLRVSLFDQRRIAKIEEEVDLLDEFIFGSRHPATIFRFHRGLSREVDQLLAPNELADAILYQETLPMLRVMCVYEALNKAIADSLSEDETITHDGKRRTRNSKGKQHCLERISPEFRAHDDGNLTSWEVGERLAKRSLLYINDDQTS